MRIVVRVLPDVPAIDREFDYLVPEAWRVDGRAARVEPGTIVRVVLHGRRVRGWVTAVDVVPPAGLELAELTRFSGVGPTAEVLELAGWVAGHWVGRRAHVLRTASPPKVVPAVPPAPAGAVVGDVHPWFAELVADQHPTVARIPPTVDVAPVILAAANVGPTVVAAPSQLVVDRLLASLRSLGARPIRYPERWADAAAGGGIVVGTRAVALAPVPDLAAAVVVDEHDEAHRQEQTPTWHARDVLLERCRRLGSRCVLTSPMPTLEALDAARLVVPRADRERAGWPRIESIDMRSPDRPAGLFGERLTTILRGEGRVLCVLNRRGRSRLLACTSCDELAVCEKCSSVVTQPDSSELRCPVCDHRRPVVCASCGSARFKNLRLGVTRAVEELGALIREPVAELTAESAGEDATRVVVGTEAALHRDRPFEVVAFLDFDQELSAPRYRAGEQALALLVRAGRIVGRRDGPGRVVVQTRQPDHYVIRAAATGDPALLSDHDRRTRSSLGLPPARALGIVSGPGARTFVDRLGRPVGIDVRPVDDRWTVMADDRESLAEVLGAVERPTERVRVELDPLRF